MSKLCYCDSLKSFDICCEPFLLGKKSPQCALELMRSRYSAYVLRKGQYLYDTCSPKLKNKEDIESINTQVIDWIGLKVQSFSDNEVKFVSDRETGRFRGFGFVEMADGSCADEAICDLEGKEFDGRTLRVNEARPRPARPPRDTW